MKAVAVIDIPDVSNIEDMFLTGNVHISYKTNDIHSGLIQGLDKIPLKPMPDIKTKEAIKLANMINPKATFQEFADGWNACIEEILNGR